VEDCGKKLVTKHSGQEICNRFEEKVVNRNPKRCVHNILYLDKTSQRDKRVSFNSDLSERISYLRESFVEKDVGTPNRWDEK